ncbi:hypothetical protein D3C77_595900 [compost metagenome]
MLAASRISLGTLMSPAIYITIMYPAYCHIVTMISAQNALSGSASQDELNSGIPAFSPKYTMTFEKINCHIKPSTIPPTRFGMKNPARNIFWPFSPLVNPKASKKATMFTNATVKNTYLSVSPNDCQNTLS